MNLPQCEILSTPRREILFIAGGRVPDSNWFKTVAQGRKIFAVDRGIELCRALNILPEILIGDFDSAESSAVSWALIKKIPVERHPVDKDLTDTQLALKFVDENSAAIITGAFGGRFDHAFSTIFTCAHFPAKIFLADEREIIFYVRGGESVTVNFFSKPFALSLLPMSGICRGVTIKNVHWELDNATLAQNFPSAVSNRVESSEVQISVGSGILAVYCCFSESFSRTSSA
ncbi:MAG: thiamine diphosphokinase [Selenomonadaceae bacterium]|nr:thiamine diphosphokinase [Selenomonadaceae bacterium]